MMRRLPLPALLVLLAAAVAIAVAGQVLLQATFASVKHPVSLFVANTTADPQTVRGWYSALVEQGTLERMVATELVDFVWIGGIACAVFLLTLTCARLLARRNPVASARLYGIAPWVTLAPLLDVVENGFSLLMLSDPMGFPDVLAYLHAAASWIKLAAIVAVATSLPSYALWAAWAGGRGAERKDRLSPRVAAPGSD
ncbi:hypothetical protein [Devosia geojensis]|uniref:hypothetical protein n=1 Tax=Devosia geojensis TaxID=443610 RepID=UPI0006975A29|nr:hypothetical protein [Devosia geojensis]